ncbi:MAG: hypothetical protein COA71_14600 [SAR86 cluster bacterium]|uniref:Uncharacterized protein n=1 Tax=SAR86 cluster bacterium TaxID=2030880 RepID=A0A2A5C5V6_9GAMM|nr:MAG: hypothetical protein COA71_14600 [SAR86 cluster bacterium]
MADYLTICQDVARECGIAGGADASPKPTAVTGQIGELNRVVNWVADAYTEIQGARDWRWLHKKFTVDTVDGTDVYASGAVTDSDAAATITRFKAWHVDDPINPPKQFLKSSGTGSEVFLAFVKWPYFEHLYKTGSLQDQKSQPIHITVNRKDELQLGLTPDAVYTVTGYYLRSAQILAANTDTPEMPSDYHSLIKYQAMEYYGIFESAPEIIARAQFGMRRIMNQLKRNQEAPFRIAGYLA